jgi:hypothetical protein
MSSRSRRAAVLQNVVHILTALVLALKGISKLEHASAYWPVIVFFFASAAWILAITILHDRLHAHERVLTASVYAIECVATAIMAGLYLAEGKRGLPWAMAVAAIAFAVALVVHLRKTSTGSTAHAG